MSNKSFPGPYSGHPHISQDQAQLALDDLFEMEQDGGARLLWPGAKPVSANQQLDLTTESRESSVEFDFSHESPPKEKMPLTQAAKPPVVKVAKNPVVPSVNVAPKPDKIQNNKTGGMSALFKTGDANKELVIGVYINNHTIYGKGKFAVVTEDDELKEYFSAVDDNSGAEAGISWTMENPTKAAQSAVEERLLAHAVLKAQNVVNGKGPTPDDNLAHSDPIPVRKSCLNELVLYQNSIGNKVLEGYRLIKPNDKTKIMVLSFEHMIEWAKVRAKGTEAKVTLDLPPMGLPGFKWESIKRSLVTTTPMISSKRTKATLNEAPAAAAHWGYTHMQGMHIQVDFEEARRISHFSTIDDFIKFAKVPDQDVDHITETLEDHRVQSFYPFLFPESFNARDMERWGIPMGLGLDLMACARQFYIHLLLKEETKLSKTVIPDSEDKEDYDVKVMATKPK